MMRRLGDGVAKLSVCATRLTLQAKGDRQEDSQRQESDFLAAENQEGETIDFHSLRHTCGGLLAMIGTHPKVIQNVMRHSTIILTMDTYGHLFPGQEADAVIRMQEMLTGLPEVIKTTGTDDSVVGSLKEQHMRSNQDAKQCAVDATQCNEQTNPRAHEKTPKPFRIANLGAVVQHHAKGNVNTTGKVQTPDDGILNPLQVRRTAPGSLPFAMAPSLGPFAMAPSLWPLRYGPFAMDSS